MKNVSEMTYFVLSAMCSLNSVNKLEMWASVQHDGCPAK